MNIKSNSLWVFKVGNYEPVEGLVRRLATVPLQALDGYSKRVARLAVKLFPGLLAGPVAVGQGHIKRPSGQLSTMKMIFWQGL